MTSPPSSKNIRLTITVTPEVHATFERMAKASSMSLSRAMGEWLGDTSDAAEHLAGVLERARAAPKKVARELHSFALGLTDETGELLERIRQEGVRDRTTMHAQRASAAGSGTPPSSNTGGKGTKSTTKKRSGGSK